MTEPTLDTPNPRPPGLIDSRLTWPSVTAQSSSGKGRRLLVRAVTCFGLLLTCLIPSLALAGSLAESEEARATLKGLRGVAVVVEGLGPAVERDGLLQSTIQTDVELKLRQAGIRVLTAKESGSSPGNPYIYVNVNVIRTPTGLYAYAFSVSVELTQRVLLQRSSNVSAFAVTWATAEVGAVTSAGLLKIREAVRDRTDEFINAYLAVNPK